ncbi:hypothetical protein [Paenibacillus macerans]|uniref:hypothetical protein n=1 Tax=Paenibacillus macerans TaxID=44252 RepID=UPI0020400087|nr:hypothetical protein [Paenibacillus macerans]
MFQVTHFEIIRSEWPNENGDYYFTISDGVQEKGEFMTRKEAEDNMERIMLNWRCDS